MSITKTGIISSHNIYESEAMNVLNNSNKYTVSSPYTFSGTAYDLYVTTDMYGAVNPGETYYFSSKTDREWANGHGYSEAHVGKVTIWLYLLKTYDPSNYDYDSPICFNTSSSNMVASGIWKYTIPTGYNMARVRFNSYANESNKVTCKFWDTMLIPEKYYITPPQLTNTIALRVGKDYISTGKLYEI